MSEIRKSKLSNISCIIRWGNLQAVTSVVSLSTLTTICASLTIPGWSLLLSSLSSFMMIHNNRHLWWFTIINFHFLFWFASLIIPRWSPSPSPYIRRLQSTPYLVHSCGTWAASSSVQKPSMSSTSETWTWTSASTSSTPPSPTSTWTPSSSSITIGARIWSETSNSWCQDQLFQGQSKSKYSHQFENLLVVITQDCTQDYKQ